MYVRYVLSSESIVFTQWHAISLCGFFNHGERNISLRLCKVHFVYSSQPQLFSHMCKDRVKYRIGKTVSKIEVVRAYS